MSLVAPRSSAGSMARLWLGLGLGVVALVASTAAVGASPTALEVAVANAATSSGFVAAASNVVSSVGNVAVWWAIVLLLAAGLARTSPRTAAELVAIAGVAEAANLVLKSLVSRARPAAATADDLIVSASYPSGHVTRVAVVLGACLVLLPIARHHPRASIGLAVTAVVVMAFARVGAGDHYIADVLGGALLATVILAAWALTRLGVPSRTAERREG